MGGCCYGIPCKYGFVMKESPNVMRFPIQLVEAGFEFLIFLILLCLEKPAYTGESQQPENFVKPCGKGGC